MLHTYLIHCAGRMTAKLAPDMDTALAWARQHYQTHTVFAVQER